MKRNWLLDAGKAFGEFLRVYGKLLNGDRLTQTNRVELLTQQISLLLGGAARPESNPAGLTVNLGLCYTRKSVCLHPARPRASVKISNMCRGRVRVCMRVLYPLKREMGTVVWSTTRTSIRAQQIS